MTDTLRDRIMAALAPHRYGSASTSAKAVDYARADAVIEALGLEQERRVGPGEPGEGLSGFIRYDTAPGVGGCGSIRQGADDE